ncbi:MAG TPA: DUF892 family protein [Flavobacterium sp.]|jgi:ferritin-like metal-binding protein YciE
MKKSTSSRKPAASKSKAVIKKVLSLDEVRSVFDDQLRKRFWSEKELQLLLPKLAKRATSYELATAIDEHLAITEKQVVRLIHVFDALGERAGGIKCDIMAKWSQDIQTLLSDKNFFGYPADNAIINVWQKIMKSEILSYIELREHADVLGEIKAAALLLTAVNEEKAAHAILRHVGLSAIYFDQAG